MLKPGMLGFFLGGQAFDHQVLDHQLTDHPLSNNVPELLEKLLCQY